MTRRFLLIGWCLVVFGGLEAQAQFGEMPISTFGYFQVSFQHQTLDSQVQGENSIPFREDRVEVRENTFAVQQLNLIFQSDLSRQWRAFLDLEMLNNFSSSRRWGSFNINEAWISYRASAQLTVKAGLHVPVFNHLNDIKNRTPLLPYVIRPLVYEESFGEFIAVEDFVPERAFLQAKGFWPVGRAKIDYAVFLGNSPNVRSQYDNERYGEGDQTGIDTTATVLVGGRVGVRYREVELGVSGTRETENLFVGLESALGVPDQSLNGMPKRRLGADLSFLLGRFSFEGEVIAVRHDVDLPPPVEAGRIRARSDLNLERTFYYGTLGYHVNERLFAYGSYWFADQVFLLETAEGEELEDVDIEVPTVGIRYSLLQDDVGFDRVTLKAQYAYALVDYVGRTAGEDDISVLSVHNVVLKDRIHFIAIGVSVLF